jgi:hypothetical protein
LICIDSWVGYFVHMWFNCDPTFVGVFF